MKNERLANLQVRQLKLWERCVIVCHGESLLVIRYRSLGPFKVRKESKVSNLRERYLAVEILAFRF